MAASATNWWQGGAAAAYVTAPLWRAWPSNHGGLAALRRASAHGG
jgi:hypothetical protein